MEQKILDQITDIWFSVKEKTITCCPGVFGAEGETRRVNEGQGARGEHELSDFRSFDKPDVRPPGQSEYDELGEHGYKANGSIDVVEGEFNEYGGDPRNKISAWQAGWNVTNAIQGMFIVCLPYATLHGGYWAIFALVAIAYICCYTGKILVACLYEVDENGQLVRVRDSYVAIAQAVMGERYGGKIVNIAQIIELLMTCILYVVLCGDLMIASFPSNTFDQRCWMMTSAILLLPCAFLKDLKSVSMLSFWCTIAHIVINIIIFGYCFLQIGDWYWSKVTFHIDFQTFPITVGIVVFSYTSQIFLPSLEGNMADRSEFSQMLDWSHIAAAAFKGLFAYVGFLTFGEATQKEITNNLPTHGFKAIINIILVVKALLSYPLPYYAAAGLIETALFKRKPNEDNPHGVGSQPFPTCWERDGEYRVWAVSLRVVLVLSTLIVAISIPQFALLMGLVGNITGTMLSFVWPCYFHMKIKWNEMDTRTRAWEISIICIGLVSGFIGVITSFNALIDVYHLPLPYAPGQEVITT
ncbi:vesicular inhibitory amino acid transporter-like [Tetranychus urticae]|uniref:Vesicular inhibitory amino acid transporter n=1 Tax=Tetranychus urticae TaxID=32264 RepID=T1JYQ9_TETUR|nr:vesicular inhibitory amino acid transporter-like [Tetranychus urticae]